MTLELTAAVHERNLDLDLTLVEGETVALLGPNGAGKSTLLQVLSGLITPDSGRATLGGRTLFDVTGADARGGSRRDRALRPHERGIALLAQDALLFPHLSARENVAFGLRSRGVSRAESHRIADEWLGRVDASHLADRRPSELSGGQAQRIAVARALAVDPQLLLLDEPMAALDVSVTPALRRLLREVLADRMAIIVTHDVLDAIMLADRVVLVDGGRLVDAGPTRQAFERPATTFAAGLAGLNFVTGTRDADDVVIANGHRLAVSFADDVAQGAEVGVCVRPTAVEVVEVVTGDRAGDRASDHVAASSAVAAATNVVRATATDLEPRDDRIRVHADLGGAAFAADLPAARVADLDLQPGSELVVEFAASDTLAYAV